MFEGELARLRGFFAAGETRAVAFRVARLRAMERWMDEHEAEILAALRADLNKPPFEAYATEVGVVRDELRLACRKAARWARERRVPTPRKQLPARCFVRPEPYGVALILAPWNYPFQLALAPLVAAVAAGNCVAVKPSDEAPATAVVVARLIAAVFVPGHVTCLRGGLHESEALLRLKFDYIFFTAGATAGRSVLHAAAETLTPVTLELGGKSPCIVDETADLTVAARRIVWGKFLNAGQTCVAPDYVLAKRSIAPALEKAMIQTIRAFYGDAPCRNDAYGKIINARHFARLQGLLAGCTPLYGGETDAVGLKIAPTLLGDVDWDSAVMEEEIFGPLLPVLVYDSLDEALGRINARPRPLALYLFTRSRSNRARVLGGVSFGGGCVNDTVLHLAVPGLPFGGVGDSGMGSYHGKAGFDTFSHTKSILQNTPSFDLPVRYPPYGASLTLLKKL